MKKEILSRDYGTRVRRLEIPGLVATERRRPPGLSIPRHAHRYTNISLVLEGAFRETVGGVSHDCRPGTVIFRPAGEPHENRYGETEARSLIVEVLPERLAALRETTPVLDRARHLRGGPLPALAARVENELRRFDAASPLAIESVIFEILAHATRETFDPGVPGWLRRAREIAHDRFSHPMSLSEIAAQVGVHPSHLAKAFRRHFHCTLGEYVRGLRLERAVRELRVSDRPIAEIALACGFYDQSHLTHQTRLRLGSTPAELRRAGKARTK